MTMFDFVYSAILLILGGMAGYFLADAHWRKSLDECARDLIRPITPEQYAAALERLRAKKEDPQS